SKQGTFTFYITIAGGAIALILLFIAVRNNRKKRMYLKNYNNLLKERSVQHKLPVVENEQTYTVAVDQSKDFSTYQWTQYSETEGTKENNTINKKIWDELTLRIHTFEENNEFLKGISLNDLAAEWNSNRTYISKYINQTKGKQFTDYLNDLRIDYFLKASATDKRWTKLKIEAIAKKLGFTSARSFSTAFTKRTEISPSFYLNKEKEQLKKRSLLANSYVFVCAFFKVI